jgi:esterase/lipase superfamily enzyme
MNSRFRPTYRLIGLALFVLSLSTIEAHAANPEEGLQSWIAAILTVAGVGWLWKRTLKAADVFEVWYGTNRRDKIANTFDNEFGTKLHFGKCRVSIPKSHIFGSIGSSPFKRWIQRLFSGSDDRLELIKLMPLSPNEFEKGIRARLNKFNPGERSILIFVHGYNVKFSEAAIRAAQIGFDLKLPGAMALFSWPSRADVKEYFADADMVAASEPYLIEFILQLWRAAGNTRINVIAHSMGNLGLLRALTAGFADLRLKGVRFGQIFLAAPDIDVKLFRQLSKIYPHCSERTTLYISATDNALAASRFFHSNQRTGYSPPVTIVNGIDTVEATHVDLSNLGHGYYAAAAPILYDMASLVRGDIPPQKRPGLFEAQSQDGQYWVIRAQAH